MNALFLESPNILKSNEKSLNNNLIPYRGTASTFRRYRFEIIGGYGFPLIISLLTVIVEFAAERCSHFRPRFGEEHCFFAGKVRIQIGRKSGDIGAIRPIGPPHSLNSRILGF